ncbi:uncharacterized protein LOC100182065 isoform X1 [Ciona intestinalis]
MGEVKVRYSNFGDVTDDVASDVDDGEGNPLSRELGLNTMTSRNIAHYRLMRPRKINEVKISAESAKPDSTKRKRRHRLSSEERRCVALLQSRIFEIVDGIKSERSSLSGQRPVTVGAKTERKKDSKDKDVRPKTHHGLLRHNSGTKEREKLSSNESLLLKNVLSEVLKRKLRGELSSMKGERSATPPSRHEHTSQSSQVTGDTTKCLEIIKKRIKEKINNMSSDVISENVSSSGDVIRDVAKPGNEKEERPRVMLFSVAGSSRGSTAEWVMKQQFDEYRN